MTAESFDDDDDIVENDESDNNKGSSRNLKIALLSGLILLFVASGGIALYFAIADNADTAPQKSRVTIAKKRPAKEDIAPVVTKEQEGIFSRIFSSDPVYYRLPDIMTSSKDGAGIRIIINIQLAEKDQAKMARDRAPRAVDAIQLYLRGKTKQELSGVRGSNNTRADLLETLQEILVPAEVKEIYFESFIVR